MASPPPLREQNWHELIEHYTPDGALGRGLFGLVVGSASVTIATFGVVLLLNGPLLGALFGLAVGTVGIAGVLLTLTTLWPLYLSVIGNVESADAYGTGSEPGSAEFETDETVAGTDPEAILKRRYAAGELTREEFERRLDNVMDTRPETRRRASSDGDESSGSDGTETRRHTDYERTRN